MSVLMNFVLVSGNHACPGGVIHVSYKVTVPPFNVSIAVSCQSPYTVAPATIAVTGESGIATLTISGGPSPAIVAVTAHLGQSHGFAVVD